MIICVFRPTIHPGKEREFEVLLRDMAIPLVSRQAGLAAQHVGRPRDPSSAEYLFVTVWEDVESIRAFAGERWQEAVQNPARTSGGPVAGRCWSVRRSVGAGGGARTLMPLRAQRF